MAGWLVEFLDEVTSRSVEIDNQTRRPTINCPQHRLSDRGERDVPDLLKVEVRQIGKLVGGDRGVDDCRSLDRQGVADRFLQLVGLARREAGATAGARANAAKSGLGNSMACVCRPALRSPQPPGGSSQTQSCYR
jgi:hypothetical protein